MSEPVSLLPGSLRRPSRDHVSAHRIALLALIKEFCVVKNISRGPFVHGEDYWEHTNHQKRQFALTTLELIQNPDTELKPLLATAERILHPRTNVKFTERLKELRSNGVASIMDFIQSLEVLLVEPQHNTAVAHKSSILGLFIRRMLLAFDKLSFSNVVKLHHKFNRYYDNAFSDAGSEVLDIEDDNPTLASQKQAEFFIAQQAALLQVNEGEALAPPELQKRIRELLQGNPDLAEAHYLSYLNALRVKEFIGAVEYLYHYFDRCSPCLNQDSKITANTAAAPNSEEATRGYRYAALNLAILHAKFQHRDEALCALRESINMAQDANDNVCLQHALSWLNYLDPEKNDNHLERSIAKSSDLSLWYLSSVGVQAKARLKALQGAPPTQVFELNMKSDILNCQHSITDLLSTAYAQRAALWDLYGNSCMNQLFSQLLLFLNTSDPALGHVNHLREGNCLALGNLAFNFSLKGEYEASAQILEHCKSLFPENSNSSNHWRFIQKVILFQRALHHGQWKDAQEAINAIFVLNTNQGLYRKAEFLLEMGNLKSCHEAVKELLQVSKTEPHFHVRVLILQARLHLTSLQEVSHCLPPLAQALSLATQYHLLYLASQVKMHLAAVQYFLGIPSQALHTLQDIYVNIMAQGVLFDIACLQLLYAKCLVAASVKTKNQKSALLTAVGLLKKSVNLFNEVEAYNRSKHALYWQARFYNELGDLDNRNRCSLRFRQLEEQTKHYSPNALLLL